LELFSGAAQQGYRLATSNGGVLTGRGADIILIDDPLKPEEALSDTQRQAANEWFSHTLYSRLNNKRHGAIVIIMRRYDRPPLALTGGSADRRQRPSCFERSQL
jgi:hypothetical protein